MVKAAVLTGVGQLETREFPIPRIAETDALLKVEFCGVCGTDPHLYHGHLPVPHPLILGHEVSGILAEMGPKFPRKDVIGNPLKEGDRISIWPCIECRECYICRTAPQRYNLCEDLKIYGCSLSCENEPHLLGGYAEYMYLYQGTWMFKASPEVSPEVVSLADPLAVSLKALQTACSPGLPWTGEGFGIGKTVIVQGLGALGLLAAAGAKFGGATRVIGVEGAPLRIAIAREFGIDEVVDLKEFKTSEERIAEVMRLTRGIGADVVIEFAGVPEAFREGIQMTRRGGKLVEAGHFTSAGTVAIDPQAIAFREIEIGGVWAFPGHMIAQAFAMMDRTRGVFPYDKIISHKFKVEDADKAIQAAIKKTCIKAAIMGE